MVCCLMETWVVMQDGGHLGCHLIFYPIFRSYQKTAEIQKNLVLEMQNVTKFNAAAFAFPAKNVKYTA